MPIEDLNPAATKGIEAVAHALDVVAAAVGAGKMPASTPLFRACAQLCRSADKLYRVVELDLHVQLATAPEGSNGTAEVRS